MPQPNPDSDVLMEDSYAPNPPIDETTTRSRHASVEDVPDEGEDSTQPSVYARRFHRYFAETAKAGEVLRQSETMFEKWEREDRAAAREPWSPFASRDEWYLTRFMVKNLGQNATEEFLHLGLVS